MSPHSNCRCPICRVDRNISPHEFRRIWLLYYFCWNRIICGCKLFVFLFPEHPRPLPELPQIRGLFRPEARRKHNTLFTRVRFWNQPVSLKISTRWKLDQMATLKLLLLLLPMLLLSRLVLLLMLLLRRMMMMSFQLQQHEQWYAIQRWLWRRWRRQQRQCWDDNAWDNTYKTIPRRYSDNTKTITRQN